MKLRIGKKKSNGKGRYSPGFSDSSRKVQQLSSVKSYYTGERKTLSSEYTSRHFSTTRKSEKSRIAPSLKVMGSSIIIVLLLMLIRLSPSPSIRIANPGSLLRKRESYEGKITDVIKSDIFSKTKLTFREGHIAKEVQLSLPEFQNVSVKIPFLGYRPIIYATIDTAIFRYNASGKQFILGRSGRLVSEISDDIKASTLGLPLLQEEVVLQKQSGDAIMSATTAQHLQRFCAILTDNNMNVVSATLLSNGSEYNVAVGSHEYKFKVSLQFDAELQAGRAVAADSYLSKNLITPTTYIDLRVDERAYYQ